MESIVIVSAALFVSRIEAERLISCRQAYSPDSRRPSICKFSPITHNRERFCPLCFSIQVKCHIDKTHFFSALPVNKRDSINGESKLCNWSALCCKADLGPLVKLHMSSSLLTLATLGAPKTIWEPPASRTLLRVSLYAGFFRSASAGAIPRRGWKRSACMQRGKLGARE
jgi:hypothetical protein